VTVLTEYFSPFTLKSMADTYSVPMMTLIRFARRTYSVAISQALREVGCSDLPRGGMYVLGSMIRSHLPPTKIASQLGFSKEKASSLIDQLIELDYIEFKDDTAFLTERGKLAQETSRNTIEKIDTELLEVISPEYLEHTRTTLTALIDIHDGHHNLPRGLR
jgi:DNA-binding MarR family transcriptional regulator